MLNFSGMKLNEKASDLITLFGINMSTSNLLMERMIVIVLRNSSAPDYFISTLKQLECRREGGSHSCLKPQPICASFSVYSSHETGRKKSNPVKIWSRAKQINHLQLTIQNKSAAPAWMMIIFVSSLVDMLVGPDPSVGMIDIIHQSGNQTGGNNNFLTNKLSGDDRRERSGCSWDAYAGGVNHCMYAQLVLLKAQVTMTSPLCPKKTRSLQGQYVIDSNNLQRKSKNEDSQYLPLMHGRYDIVLLPIQVKKEVKILKDRGEQMASEIPLDWSQHVVNNTVILLRLTPMLKGTDLSVAIDVFEISYNWKFTQARFGHFQEWLAEEKEMGRLKCGVTTANESLSAVAKKGAQTFRVMSVLSP
ncbi:hypothetical protein llap_9144 [Limosa lapponica baueri]|uniref:Uncharacterized protein n=1 Tax=Limosa lapponica baueri TaxID=1758121 RepID=A0A2I0U3F3_LIMLA|nr:hypothetical protein llap_9144 [Limosa lapponica baueri]